MMKRARFKIGGSQHSDQLSECLLLSAAPEELSLGAADRAATAGLHAYINAGKSSSKLSKLTRFTKQHGHSGARSDDELGLFDGMVIMSDTNDGVTATAQGSAEPAPAVPKQEIELPPTQPPPPQPAPSQAPQPQPAGETSAPANTVVTMVVPPGVIAGQVLTLETGTGDVASVQLPPGASPGATVQFAVSKASFWDRAESLAGKLLSKASEIFGGLLMQQANKPKPVLEALGEGTLLCVSGTTRLRHLSGAVHQPVVAGCLEIFGRRLTTSGGAPASTEDGSPIHGWQGVLELRLRARGNARTAAAALTAAFAAPAPKAPAVTRKAATRKAAKLAEEAELKRRELAAAIAVALVAEGDGDKRGPPLSVTLAWGRDGSGLGMVVDDSCVVLAVQPGRPAAMLRIEPQSQIRAVEGQLVVSKAELLHCLSTARCKATVELEIQPPPAPLAVVCLDPAATSVLEPLPGQFHFRAAVPHVASGSRAGPWGVLAMALPDADRDGHEQLRKLLQPVWGARFVSCFGEAAKSATAEEIAAGHTATAQVRKGFSLLKNMVDLVDSTMTAAHTASGQHHSLLGSAVGAATAARATAAKVMREQANDPLRRHLPQDWAELPTARVGSLVLVKGRGEDERVACQAVLKLRGKLGWLVLYDRASHGAQKVRKSAAAALEDAKVAGLSLAHFAGELDFAADAPQPASLLRADALARPDAVMMQALELYEMAGAAVDVELLRLEALNQAGQRSVDHDAVEEDALLRQRAFADRAAALREALGRSPPVAAASPASLAQSSIRDERSSEWNDGGHTVAWFVATADITAVTCAQAADSFQVESAPSGKEVRKQLLLASTAAEAAEWTSLLWSLANAARASLSRR